MKLADPILISQIISSLGLTGQEAETKRQELEKLSNDELNKLIANVSSYSPISLGGFTALENQNKFSGNVFQEHFVDNSSTSFSTIQSTQPKEYTRVQQKELDRFLGDFLYNSASSGLQEITAYNNSIGTLNITDRAVNGFKVLTGQQDRIGLQEQMTEEVAEAQKLKKAAYSQPGAFESKIERKFGVPYSHSNVEQLKTASEEFTRVSVYRDKTELLEQGFSEVKNILREEQEYAQAKKYVRGTAAASLTPPEISSHEKFGEVLLQFCNGDKNLVNEYMKNLSSSMGSRAEIEKNLPQIMDELIAKSKAQEQEALGGKTFSQYEQDYNTACKKVFGTKGYKETAQNFVSNAKTQAAYTEMGLTIATSLLLPGSSVVKSGMQKAALKYGEKTAVQGFKAAMTVGTASMPATLSTLNAATSEEGFTPEKIAEIQEKFKNGLVYGGFGAYASGPLGNAVEKVLSKNPTMLSNIVGKTMGTATETGADVLFDRITSDLSFTESLKQNGVMNFGMMIAGGRIAKGSDSALSSLKVAKNNDGTYSVKDQSGSVVFKANDENALAGSVFASGINNAFDKSGTDLFKKKISPNFKEMDFFKNKNTPKPFDANFSKSSDLQNAVSSQQPTSNNSSVSVSEIKSLADLSLNKYYDGSKENIAYCTKTIEDAVNKSSVSFVKNLIEYNVPLDSFGLYVFAYEKFGEKNTLLAVELGADKFNISGFLEKTKDILPFVSDEMHNLKNIYGIESSGNLTAQAHYGFANMPITGGDDTHLRLKDSNGTVFKFDSVTGKLLSVNKGNQTINISSQNTIISSLNLHAPDLLLKMLKNKNVVLTDDIIKQATNFELVLSNFTPNQMDIIVKNQTGEQVAHDLFIESNTSSRQIAIRNNNGDVIDTETVKGLSGEYEIYSVAPDGKKYLTGLAELDTNGGKHVEKHLTSLDGTTTDTVYADDVSGNTFLHYEIKDKDGNSLYNSTKTRKQLSENHYQTTSEITTKDFSTGQEKKVKDLYDIKILADKIVVLKLDSQHNPTGEIVEYKIKDFSAEDYKSLNSDIMSKVVTAENFEDSKSAVLLTLQNNNISENTIDRTLVPMMCKLSGEEWFKLNDNETRLLVNESPIPDNAFSATGLISFSETFNGDISVFLHEAGHERFVKLDLINDKDLEKIYSQEKEQFTTAFPDEIVGGVQYFLSNNNISARGVNETVAETNLITNTHFSEQILEMRTALLQQYFPKTIAYVANKTAMLK